MLKSCTRFTGILLIALVLLGAVAPVAGATEQVAQRPEARGAELESWTLTELFFDWVSSWMAPTQVPVAPPEPDSSSPTYPGGTNNATGGEGEGEDDDKGIFIDPNGGS